MKTSLLILSSLLLCQTMHAQIGSTEKSEILVPTTIIYQPVFADSSLTTNDPNLVWTCSNGISTSFPNSYVDLKTFQRCTYNLETYQKKGDGSYQLLTRQIKVELLKTGVNTLTYTELKDTGEIALSKSLHFDINAVVKTDSAYIANQNWVMALTITKFIEVK